MKKKSVLGICVVSLLLMTVKVQSQPVVLLSTLDAQVDSWGGASGTSTVLATGDGALAEERIWHTFLRFDLPTLAPGETFGFAQLQLFQTNYWSWTAGNATSPAAFRVWETDNSWDNTITWATQPTKFQLPVWPLVDVGDLLDTQVRSNADSSGWVTWDVLGVMSSGATISLVMDVDRDAAVGLGGGGAWYHSFEQGSGPRIEYTIVPIVCSPVPQADFTGDCKVDIEDLAVMVSEWLMCNWSDPGLCL